MNPSTIRDADTNNNAVQLGLFYYLLCSSSAPTTERQVEYHHGRSSRQEGVSCYAGEHCRNHCPLLHRLTGCAGTITTSFSSYNVQRSSKYNWECEYGDCGLACSTSLRMDTKRNSCLPACRSVGKLRIPTFWLSKNSRKSLFKFRAVWGKSWPIESLRHWADDG